ncbi:hypothetical protein T484DRAFT_1815430 [Baffinella frigidus]|nr:hypothetical protein T484DRAFT_1815430 [Cryptophyta sp. CCMP2293]
MEPPYFQPPLRGRGPAAEAYPTFQSNNAASHGGLWGVGVGLILEPSTGRSLIRRVGRGGAAEMSGAVKVGDELESVGDELASVNRKEMLSAPNGSNVGDELVSVNRKEMVSAPNGSLHSLLLGPIGSTVEIGVRSQNSQQVLHVNLVRGPTLDQPGPVVGGKQDLPTAQKLLSARPSTPRRADMDSHPPFVPWDHPSSVLPRSFTL